MIVVDASVVVDVLTHRELSGLRSRLATEAMHAPDLLDHEFVRALRGLTLGGHLSATRAQDALTDYDALAVRRHPSSPGMRAQVWAMRASLTSYDAAYVALARGLGCPLLTRDGRLAAGAGRGVPVEVV